MGLRLVIRIMVVLCLLKISLATSLAKPNCQNYCGSVEIIYPFGIGPNCYLDKWFEIECVYGVPHIRSIGVGLYSITNISQTTIDVFMLPGFKDFRGTPFFFSTIENVFVGLGCNIVASLADETENQNAIVWCASVCGSDSYPRPCEASLQENLQLLSPSIQKITTNVTINSTTTSRNTDNSSCELTFVAQQASLDSIISSLSLEDYCFTISSSVWPVTLGYMVDSDALAQHSSNVYGSNLTTDCQTGSPIVKLNNTIISNRSVQCSCKPGYIGYPYLPDGCVAHGQGNKVKWTTFIIGICSALGVLLLIIGGWFLCIAVKKYSSKRKKEKFFKQNGGLLLHQHMSATEGNVHKTKVFSSYELEKASDHYNANRVLGQGGQGTVYKGMLSDGRIVAVKRSKIADPTNVEQFINEVVILSQINQRNIVKLMGCCLETEAPLLVYEFISNGTLYQHIHNPNEENFTLTWEIRLRIVTEIARGLSYLHTAASIPIYHRDIKSTNILLDDKHKARVCDFGTSRSVDIEKTHLTTRVPGMFRYLDPIEPIHREE